MLWWTKDEGEEDWSRVVVVGGVFGMKCRLAVAMEQQEWMAGAGSSPPVVRATRECPGAAPSGAPASPWTEISAQGPALEESIW